MGGSQQQKRRALKKKRPFQWPADSHEITY
jgi:hypothetical protein